MTHFDNFGGSIGRGGADSCQINCHLLAELAGYEQVFSPVHPHCRLLHVVSGQLHGYLQGGGRPQDEIPHHVVGVLRIPAQNQVEDELKTHTLQWNF